MSRFRLVCLVVVGALCAGCSAPTASLVPHTRTFVTPSSEDPSAFDLHADFPGAFVDILYPNSVMTNTDLQDLQEILLNVAINEKREHGFTDESLQKEPAKENNDLFAFSFREVSSTIRMVSIEGREEVHTAKGSELSFHNLVYDRRINRLASLTEMFENNWPSARNVLEAFMKKDLEKQAQARSMPTSDFSSRVTAFFNGIPQWVLLPGEPNRTSSGLRFDFGSTGKNVSSDDVYQVEVPVAVFWEFLTDDWKQRFVRP
jgi:hypothetical protein